ncbi:MAG: aminoacyl-tRNA hydrolase [Pseudomonadota bacterium]
MKLFVGLGNPGSKYSQNRHNIGFMAIDSIAQKNGFSNWRSKFQGLISEGQLDNAKTLLLKPQTFMNLSGQSVGEAIRFHKIDPLDVYVFHDELDLAPSKMKVKLGGGHAGHNGLRSIHSHIGQNYHRIRLGIGHPGHKDAVPSYVLKDFAKSDQEWLDHLISGIGDAAALLTNGSNDKFMNRVALNTNPPQSSKDPPKRNQRQTPSDEGAPQPDEEGRSALQKLVDKFR